VAAQVRHDDSKAVFRDLRGMAEADPVGVGVREQAVEQQHRPAIASSCHRQLDPVRRGESMGGEQSCAFRGGLGDQLQPPNDAEQDDQQSREDQQGREQEAAARFAMLGAEGQGPGSSPPVR